MILYRTLFSLFALVALVLPAKADPLLDFQFSMTLSGGGTMTGEIEGLSDSGASTPTDIIITSQPAGYTYAAPQDLLALDSGYQILNGDDTFTVASGTITASNFAIYKPIGTNGAQGYGFGVTYDGYTDANGIYQVIGSTVTTQSNTAGVMGANYTTAVPEPRKTALIFLLAAIGLLGVRKLQGSYLPIQPSACT